MMAESLWAFVPAANTTRRKKPTTRTMVMKVEDFLTRLAPHKTRRELMRAISTAPKNTGIPRRLLKKVPPMAMTELPPTIMAKTRNISRSGDRTGDRGP